MKLRRIGIDTYQQPIVYMRKDCHVCKSEGFEAQSQIEISHKNKSIIATLNVVSSSLLKSHEVGLSEFAWKLLGAEEGDSVALSHPQPIESFRHVRSKLFGKQLDFAEIKSVISDITSGLYPDVHLSSFVTACSGDNLNLKEITYLTKAMIDVGDRIEWGYSPVVDKHCVGGLPGNRTTLIIVPIVTSYGLTMPKTSSRAITSPAGTADTMEVLAPVELSLKTIKRVVDKEGGCIVWGGLAKLSPADDILIKVERPLDLDSTAQLVSSILSKKAAAGSTHTVIDIPVGKTAKIRSIGSAIKLRKQLLQVGKQIGLIVKPVITDGSAPIGKGIGPALEARDVISVLQCKQDAPPDLRERALELAGQVIEFSTKVKKGHGKLVAEQILDSGNAWKKFQSICSAQGGMKDLPKSKFQCDIKSKIDGKVSDIDSRKLARVAKLAGAPNDKAAGVDLHVSIKSSIERGQPLFTIHSESRGELEYALGYVKSQHDILTVQTGKL